MRDQFFETPAVSVQGKPHIGRNKLSEERNPTTNLPSQSYALAEMETLPPSGHINLARLRRREGRRGIVMGGIGVGN